MPNIINKLFSKEEINNGRQFEFDFAKAVCILGMVFVHMFETFASPEIEETSIVYYIVVIVLDAIFGAGTFMFAMGLGIGYSYKDNPDYYIKRGFKLLLIGYLLNFVRGGLFTLVLTMLGFEGLGIPMAIAQTFCLDILQFAGLALVLFGVLKKLKISDSLLFIVAVLMVVISNVIGTIFSENIAFVYSVGLFFGTKYSTMEVGAPFPLFNWFIIVVFGYLYSKLLKRVKDKDNYFRIVMPIVTIVLFAYMIIAIPNRLGMLSGSIIDYYHFKIGDSLILASGAIFATSLYFYVSKLLKDSVKKVIIRISKNINGIYCVHWVTIGVIEFVLNLCGIEYISTLWCFVGGVLVFVFAAIVVEKHKQLKEKRGKAC